jgi:threonine/homoserine/homoserine lactone efflux protein
LNLDTLLFFLASSIALTLFPGPDILFVFSTSLAKGWRKGIIVSLGLTSGLWIHTLLVIFGISNLLLEYPKSQRMIECLGGSYLLFLAFRIWQTKIKKDPKENSTIVQPAKQRFYFTGLLMNITNPKVSLFFISFFPGFLFHDSWSYSFQFLILGMLFFLQAFVFFSVVSIFAAQLGNKLVSNEKSIFWNRSQAVVLVLIALVLFYP